MIPLEYQTPPPGRRSWRWPIITLIAAILIFGAALIILFTAVVTDR